NRKAAPTGVRAIPTPAHARPPGRDPRRSPRAGPGPPPAWAHPPAATGRCRPRRRSRTRRAPRRGLLSPGTSWDALERQLQIKAFAAHPLIHVEEDTAGNDQRSEEGLSSRDHQLGGDAPQPGNLNRAPSIFEVHALEGEAGDGSDELG